MLRKLVAVAVLAIAAAAVTTRPAPAINYICSCTICQPGSGLACVDVDYTGRRMACGTYYSQHC